MSFAAFVLNSLYVYIYIYVCIYLYVCVCVYKIFDAINNYNYYIEVSSQGVTGYIGHQPPTVFS